MTKKKAAKKKVATKKVGKPIKVTFDPRKKQRIPEFEQALAEEAKLAELRKAEENEKAGRSDTRPGDSAQDPGAQGPPESTVPPKPKAARALAPVLKIPFAIWSKIDEIPELKLSQDEALEWAEPIADILEYYFPGKIPEIAWMWLMLLESTGRVIDSRVEIRHQKKKQLEAAPETAEQQGSDSIPSSTRPANSPAPQHNGAEPAEGYPKE